MRKNEFKKFLYSCVIIAMASLFVFACGGGGGSSSGGGVLTGTISISGAVKAGEQITAVISADTNGTGAPVYTWERINIGTTIDVGTDAATLLLKDDDIGGLIRVTVSYIDYIGSLTCETADNVAPNKQGTGQSGDPLLVYSVTSLQKIGTEEVGVGNWSFSAHYEQIVDIDLSSVENWEPIGNNSTNFTGSYDGNNKKIFSLTINSNNDYQGLFGCIGGDGTNTGSVKNIGLEDVTINGRAVVGGVVGYNTGKVENCYTTGAVNGVGSTNIFVGGVVGWNDGTVSNCYVTSDVGGAGNDVGGVVGRNSGTVSNCYATGDVEGTGNVGGVVGENNRGTVSNCYAKGYVNGNSNVGGVVGGNFGDGSTVSNCYATGDVEGRIRVGGVVGSNDIDGEVSNCYATGDVEGEQFVGGVLGGNNTGKVENCVALGASVTGSSNIGRVVGNHSGGTLSNNYACSNMNGTWTDKGNDKINGADLASTNYYDVTWWTGTAKWLVGIANTDVWNAPSSNRLPTLKNMPGDREQNPAVKTE